MNATAKPNPIIRFLRGAVLWLDSYGGDSQKPSTDDSINLVRIAPFIGIHLACFAVIWVGWSWPAVAFAAVLYVVRMFGITGVYHRYFSHRTYKLNRFWQFVFAVLGNSAAQRGPLWWAAHHRHHHRYSDEPEDIHSPKQRGFWWSHMFWFLGNSNYRTHSELIPDLVKFPELVLLDRFDIVTPFALGTASFFFGYALQHIWAVETSGSQMLVWFFISTVLCAHGTFTINSLSHVFGTRRFATSDTSRNNFLLALITLGEGWHNNHHHYQSTVRQGFRWWEIDMSWYALVVLSWVGITKDLKGVPAHIMAPSETGEKPEKPARQADNSVNATAIPGLSRIEPI